MPFYHAPRKTRNQHADAWQRLASIRLSVPGYGHVTVADLLQQVSATDTDTTARRRLSLELGNFATLLESLPPAARDEIIERITDTVREAYERDAAGG
jgi:hypothetical protein